MAAKKIYTDHAFQQGAKINFATTGLEPSVASGDVYFDGTNFKLSEDGSNYEKAVTDENTITLTNKTMDGGLV